MIPDTIDEAYLYGSLTTSDLMHRLGKLCEDRPGVINRPEGGSWDSEDRPLEGLEVQSIVRVPRKAPPPLCSAMTTRIEADWEATEQAMDAARVRFQRHRNKPKYRAECRAIMSLPDGWVQPEEKLR